MKSQIYNFDNVSKSEDEFRAATSLTDESFNNLLKIFNPGKDSCNIKFFDTSSRLSQSCDDIGSSESGPKPFRSRSVFHVYDLVKIGFARKISKSTVSRYLITWVSFCYFFLGANPIWPSSEVIDSTIPQSFKNTYPSSHCIMDSTELFCQRPSTLSIQSCMYSTL